jgi:threonine dehydratase
VPNPKQKGLHPIAREAWESIHQIYGAQCYETPLVRAEWLRERADAAQVHLKAECKQSSGSYRARGAAHKLLALSDEQLQHGVVAAGSVNHTLAVLHAAAAAAAARGIRVPAHLFVPRSAPGSRADRLRQLGGQVEVAGSDEEEAEGEARAAAQREGAAFIDALSDPQVSGGLGSIAIELLMQLPRGRLDAVFVPVGRSGGLLAGVAAVLKAADPSIKVVGVYPTVRGSVLDMRSSAAAATAKL